MKNVPLPNPVSTNNVQIPAYTLNVASKLCAAQTITIKPDVTVRMAIAVTLWCAANVPSVHVTMNVLSTWPAVMNAVKILATVA